MIAEHLSVEEVAGIKEAFSSMDIEKRGKINLDELKNGLHKLGHQIPDADVQILMEAVSCITYLRLAYFVPWVIFTVLLISSTPLSLPQGKK